MRNFTFARNINIFPVTNRAWMQDWIGQWLGLSIGHLSSAVDDKTVCHSTGHSHSELISCSLLRIMVKKLNK